MSIRLVKLDCS